MGRPKKETENVTGHVEVEAKKTRDSLLVDLADLLNKSNKEGGKFAYFLDEEDDPSSITGWVSTGSSILDLAISNRPHGGLPVGRCVELNGLESTGKSLISAHICAETQRQGGRAIVIDTESSAAPTFWKSLGVDLSKLLYLQRETVEEIFETMEQAISFVRKTNQDKILTIIVDSVAGATTKKEQESEHGVDGYNTAKAIIISKAMRKITNTIARQRVLVVFTNQLREKMNAMAFGDKYTTPGGKALGFHCSVRVRLNSAGKLKSGDEVIGNKCIANVIKNRMGPPFRKAAFNIYYDSGIADYSSWLEVMKTHSIDGCSMKSAELVNKLNTDEAYKEQLYNLICEAVIMKYKTPNSEIKDVVVDAEEEDKNEAEE